MVRALASCGVGRSSLPGRTKTLEIASVWPSARHKDCSRETLQCGCNLRRSLVVLPTFVENHVLAGNGRSLQHPERPSACGKWPIVEGIRRTILVLLLCVYEYSQLRCVRTFRRCSRVFAVQMAIYVWYCSASYTMRNFVFFTLIPGPFAHAILK